MEVELEMCHHDFDNLLGIRRKGIFQFTRIAYQHLTGRGLLLQTCRTNTEALLETSGKVCFQ